MNPQQWLLNYFNDYKKALFQDSVNEQIEALAGLYLKVKETDKKVVIGGNGGSAAIAGHSAVDLTKTAGVRAEAFHDPGLITCFANDYGYEHWLEKALEFYAREGDLVVLISSSGKSPNIINAAQFALDKGLTLVTFSGFAASNPLRKMGQINFWVDSESYNIVENTHLIWNLAACDLTIHERTKQLAGTPS